MNKGFKLLLLLRLPSSSCSPMVLSQGWLLPRGSWQWLETLWLSQRSGRCLWHPVAGWQAGVWHRAVSSPRWEMEPNYPWYHGWEILIYAQSNYFLEIIAIVSLFQKEIKPTNHILLAVQCHLSFMSCVFIKFCELPVQINKILFFFKKKTQQLECSWSF